MEESYRKFFEYNRKWVEEITRNDPDFFKRAYAGQNPDFFLIACSDSRVSPSQMLGTKPGEIFVHRNVANLAVHTDLNFLSALQYSVEVLEVKHVVVIGHYGCGGVRASLGDKYNGLIDNWLENIRDVIRLHADELKAIDDIDQRCKLLVELNVIEQAVNISHTSIIRKAWAKARKPEIHGWVYDLERGILHDLEIRDKIMAAVKRLP
ncbi:MAG: carbonic anhydrase [Balneolaceae bacterium]|nr:MAG: carbonic anhydrase [Balneolaceae bacterium]